MSAAKAAAKPSAMQFKKLNEELAGARSQSMELFQENQQLKIEKSVFEVKLREVNDENMQLRVLVTKQNLQIQQMTSPPAPVTIPDPEPDEE